MTPTRLARAEVAWLAAGVLLFAGIVWHEMAVLGDGFWCLAAGEQVLRTGALPDLDTFAFTSRHVPWVLHMVAFQVGGAWLVDHAGGLRALMVACSLPIAAAAALAWLVPARGTVARVLSFPVALAYLLVDREDISARGQAFGDLGLVVLLLVLARIRRGRRVAPWWPVLLGAAWANLHPSFLLAVVVPLGFALAERLEAPALRSPARPAILFAALALVGACANPSSVVLPVDVVRLALDPTTAHVDLFRSPDFHDPAQLLPFALAVLLLVWLAREAAEGRRARADAALLLVFVAAAVASRRYGTALLAFEAILVGARASERAWAIPAPVRARAPFVAGCAAALQAALAVACLVEAKDPLRDVPAGAVAAIDGLALPDRVFNPYHWGGYLDWVWLGKRKVFVDGRNHLFSNGVFDDARRIEGAGPGARALLDVYEIRTVLAERGSPLDAALAGEPDWQQVAHDRIGIVYVRPSGTPRRTPSPR